MWMILLVLLGQGMLCSGSDMSWTYTGLFGQYHWSEFFPDCGQMEQSPINVDTSLVQHDLSLTPLEPLGYQQYGSKPFTLTNNGHTVEMSLPPWMGLGGLPWRFSAVQLHLHWGRSENGEGRTGGSEHTINGQRSAAELHVVHYNSELYSNMSTAKHQRDGLAVLGVLIEIGDETNHAFGNIFNYLGRIRHAGQKVTIPAFDVQSLLPDDLGRYFRYNGSLTTPPCYQSVLWTVFADKVTLSERQMRKLESVLFSSRAGDLDATPLRDNYRSTQPLNSREVLASFVADSTTIYSVGEVCAMVIGAFCGCIGLAVIIRFVIKTIRSTSSWDVLPTARTTSLSRCKDKEKEQKQEVVLRTSSESEKEVSPQADP